LSVVTISVFSVASNRGLQSSRRDVRGALILEVAHRSKFRAVAASGSVEVFVKNGIPSGGLILRVVWRKQTGPHSH